MNAAGISEAERGYAGILKLYQYGQAKTPVVALVCPGCDRETSELHFASLVEEDRLECSRTKNSFGVEQHLRMWVLVSVHYQCWSNK